MADDDWKKRIGIPINYSSDSSEDEGESKCNTDERYGGLENIPASPFDSLENNIQLDEILNKYAEYGNTPPRTRISRRQRERKWKDENSGDGKASPKVVQSHSRIRRRNTIDNFPHLQVFSEFNDSEQTNQTENEQFRADSHKRKRSLKLLRESERDFKLDLATVSNNISSTMEHTEDRAESLPVIVQQPALKVETCNRFMSLTSKLVPCKEERSETPTPQKVAQLQGCPQSRLEFYKTFSLLIRMGNPDKQDKNYSRQLSKEEHLWQSELKDLIWLELQAWHADRSPTEQDQYLCNSRKEVGNLLNEITRYKFENKGCSISDSCDTVIEDKQLETDSAVFCDKNDSSSNVRSDEVKDDSISCDNSTSAQTKDTYAKVVSVPDYAAKFKKGGCFCNGCLSMYCRSCSISQNAALRQIEDLLTRLEAAEALYPSSKAFANDYPLYKSPELVGRVKAMCLWYNMTNHHRLKVSILGKLLLKSNQWPKMDDDQGSSSGVTDTSTSDDVSYEEVMSSIRHRGVDPNLDGKLFTKDNKHRVQFDFNELEAEAESVSSDSQFSSNPSDSNNSNDSRSTISSETNIRSRNMSLVDLSQDMCVKSSPTSPYRKYIEDVLKTRGLRKALQFLEHLHRIVLRRSRITLEKPVSSEDVALNVESDVPILEQTDVCNHLPNSIKNITTMTEEEEELRRYGYWSPEAQALGLPSYRGAYLFLCRIPIDVIHEYLRMRLEQKPEEPSALSIRQLMREFKEGLRIAVVHRQRYLHLIRAALWDVKPEMLDRFEQVISDFDRSVKTVMEVYLEYLQQWVLMIQQESFLITTYQKNLLEEEWNFVRATCPHIPGGEALAGNSFCRMASGMLGAIADHLNTGIDELTVHVDDSTLSDEESSTKQVMLSVCREFHSIFNEARERALKAVAFAKTLRKDLEIAASYTLNVPPVAFMKKLKETGHVRVIAPHSCSHLIFIPGNIKSYSDHIRKLLNMSCDASASEAESGYLLLTRCEDCVNIPGFWDGETISIQPTAETTITLSNVEVQGLLLVVCDPAQLSVHRRSFQKMMGDIVTLGQENCPSNYIIAESLEELKREALDLRNHITATIQKVEEKCDVREMLELDEAERASLQSRCREILHQCYKFGFEYHKEVSRLVTGDARTKLAEGLISFAKQWMYFVKERCERGRGLRPRWANQGLNFLITVLEPQNTMYLSNEEFEKLKASIDECVSHVIGTADKGHPFRNVSECRSRGTSPSPLNRKPYRSSRSVQESSDKRQHEIPRSLSSQLPRGDVSPGSPDITDSPLVRRKNQQLFPSSSLSEEKFDGCVVETIPVPSKKLSRVQRVQRAIVSLESKIEDRLHDEDLIGTVTSVRTEDKVHIRARSVTFSWQRGIKIGQGRFGKVYTAVNNQTGELMAMKEIQLQPNDHRTIRNVAEELRIFEGIHHRHLVRYYGVEIHREEMLIFMEYCAEGTLENLVAATQNGLPEELIRRFTRQLLEAVSTLHEHGIVHRDIKSANIFLTDEGNCLKLGDFGSAVKIKAHTTLPGELQGFVGTQAYMAPEVFMKTEGHGRAADIWSVGCVVVEMASGKRPWHEYDSNYQIMFKVGMGEIPTIPTTLLEEGQQFLEQCLQHDPRKRAAAADLLEHTFVKVEVDEEYLSLPLPSISEDYTRSNARK